MVHKKQKNNKIDIIGKNTHISGYSEGYGSSGSYYDLKELLSAKENKILEQNEQIAHFNRKVWDLEESLKEKDEIISARTQADLAVKGRDKLEHLKDTRKELKKSPRKPEVESRENGEEKERKDK